MSDWPLHKLGELTTVISSGATPLGGSENYHASGDVMFIRSQNVLMNQLDLSNVAFVSGDIDRQLARTRLHFGDVLLNITGASIGRVAIFNLKNVRANVNQHVCVIRTISSRLFPGYLGRYLAAPSFQMHINKIQAGGTRQALNFSQIADFDIPLPPMEEQLQIAAILEKADALRQKRRAALQKLDSLTQFIFLDEFQSREAAQQEWPSAMLMSLGKVSTGKTPPSELPGMFDGTIPFVTPGDLNGYYSQRPVKRAVTLAGASMTKIARAGATAVCCIGATIGKMAMIPTDFAFNQQINVVEWGDRIDDVYGYFAMTQRRDEIADRGASTTLPILKKSEFEKLLISVPPLDLQKRFSRKIRSLIQIRASFSEFERHGDSLFSALQSRAFKGEL